MKLVYFALLLISTSVFAAKSKEERADKKYQFLIQQGYEYKTIGQSLMFSYFIDEDNQIGLRGGFGKEDDDRETYLAIQSKHFLANSFYVAPEIYYLNYFEDDDSDNWFDNKDEKITALGFGVRIGNQWQFKTFTIGCDWFGMGKNIAHWTRTDDVFSHRYTFTILNFYLGWSF